MQAALPLDIPNGMLAGSFNYFGNNPFLDIPMNGMPQLCRHAQ